MDAAALLLALCVPIQGKPAGPPLFLPEGLEARAWATTPQLFNPTAIAVDARGRVWVTEAVNYRRWDGRNPGLARPEGDRVVILEDTDGDGTCDTTKVFAQEEGLVAPLGICVLGERVIVSCSPDLVVYTDADGDDVPERREVLLTGFGGRDHDHGLHSVVPGPDGRWYTALGNAGPHLVTDRAGWSLRSGSLYTGGGQFPADNKPGLSSDDGRAWTGGLMLRVAPDGTGLTVLAHNFRNPYECALDSFGSLFSFDNDDDGNRGCRALQVLEGGNHGFTSEDGTRYWQADRRPGQEVQRAHWHQDDPGVAPMGTITGAGGPTGVAVYEGELLAPWIDGALLAADAGRGAVFALTPLRDGAALRLEQGVLIEAREQAEGASLFRPSDVAVAPDGAVYVADWYDPGVGGHWMGDEACFGRILRIAPMGAAPASAPVADTSSLEGAAQAFRSPALAVREAGRAALVAAGEAALQALEELLRDGDRRVRARALWPLAQLGAAGRERVEGLLRHEDQDLRVAAFRALRAAGADVAALAERLALDASAAVRAEVAVALREVDDARALPLLQSLALAYAGGDRFALEAIGAGAHRREAALYELLVGQREDPPESWPAPLVELAWRLHPPSSVPHLLARARAAGLPLEQRRAMLDALAFVDDRAAGEALLDLAVAGPEDTRAYAAWWVRHRDGNAWRAWSLARQLPGEDLDTAELRFASGLLRRGSVEVDVELSGARTLWLVVDEGPNGNGYDWAAWIDPRLVGEAGEVSLTELPWSEASAAWGQVRVGRNAAGGPIVVEGKPVERGIGTHARSVIAWALPDGYVRFVARAGVDDGGPSQPGATTELELRVYTDAPRDRGPLLERERVVRDARVEHAARVEAGLWLAADREGGMLLVRAAQDGALGDALRAELAEELFRNPDPAVRALAAEHFPRPGARADGPTTKEVLALRGDPERGRAVFLAQRALCSTCHTFQGRGADVGPDLTAIREKLGREALLDALLNPSAAIAFGYDTWMVRTRDDELLTGFLLADGETLVLKDTAGVRRAVAAEEVAEKRKQRLSTMPEGLALGLEAQELADLLALLQEDPDAQPAFGDEVALFDGATLDGWTWHGPEGSRAEDVWSARDGVLVDQGTPVGYLRTMGRYESFALTFEWRFDPARGAGNSGVLLRVQEPDEVWPRSIEVQLQSGNAGDLWNIGAFGMQPDPARTSGRRTARLAPSSERPLGAWNRMEITLDGQRLEARVNGVLQNEATWCEALPGHIALQAEGAYLEFRDLRLRPILRDRPR